MPELKRNFTSSRMNKTLDERLVARGEYRDALNIEISSSEGNDVGSVQNILGNKYAYGSAISSANLGNNPKCIGVYADNKTEKIYWFVASDTKSLILEFDQTNNTVVPILVDTNSILSFNTNYLITGINIIDNLLFWTDDQTEPKKINIDDWRGYANGSYNHTQISSSDFVEDQITVIKKSPIKPPTITMSSSKRSGIIETSLNSTSFTESTSPFDPVDTGSYGNINVTNAANFIVGDKLKLTLLDGTSTEEIIVSITEVVGPRIFTINIDSISQDIPVGSQDWKVVLVEEKPIFEFKFPRFAYRYKYKDNEYSAIGPYSDVAFLPNDFDYNPKKGYNKGMVNTLRSLKVGNFTDSVPNGVTEIDILYKESSNNNIYTVQSIKTTDDEYTAGTNGEVEITSDVIYKVLPSMQSLRPYDNVPLKAKAQAMSANRIMYGNYLENFNMKDAGNNDISVKFEVSIIQDPNTAVEVREAKPSIKSLRTYQVGVVYRDAYGRETPVFTDPSGSFTLDKASSINYNVLRVKITSNIPSWAESYKYYIKEASDEYYNLAMDRHYPAEDGNVWLAFPSAERNKVSEETFLVLKKKHNSDSFVSDEARYKIISISNDAPDFIKISNVTKGLLDSDSSGVSNENIFLSSGYPQADRTYLHIAKAKWQKVFGGATNDHSENTVPVHNLSNLILRIIGSGARSQWYDVASITLDTASSYYVVSIEDKLEEDDIAFVPTYSSSNTTLSLEIAQKTVKTEPEFQGRFFTKVERDGVLESAILSPEDPNDYRVTASTHVYALNGKTASKNYWRDENKGVYPGGAGANDEKHAEWFFCGNTYHDYQLSEGNMAVGGNKHRGRLASAALAKSTAGFGAKAGNDYLEIAYHWWGGDDRDAWTNFWNDFTSQHKPEYRNIVKSLETINMKFRFTDDPDQTIYTTQAFRKSFIVAYDVSNVANGKWGSMRVIKWTLLLDKQIQWAPEDNGKTSKANATQIEFLDVYASGDEKGLTSDNPAIWETEPKETTDLNLYYEISEAFNKSVHGNSQVLTYSNCFSFGNGVESDRIRDDFNAPTIGKGVKVSTVLDTPYEEERKSSEIIYSGLYNSTSGVNETNQFIQADKITKKLNPQYGSIQLMRHRQYGLDVLCEDKCFKIPTDKDLLFTAEGNPSVTVSSNVLGTPNPYAGDYGISKNPESYAQYGFRAYFTDKARGTVLRLSNNGLEPISKYGLESYFRDNLKAATTAIGSYDVTKHEYNITLNFDTVSFKEDINGWTSRKSFLQEAGLSLNNVYYTLKDGQLWSHDNETRNEFYGNPYNSSIKFIFNDAPNIVKSFKTLNYEGTQARIFVDNDTDDPADGISNSDTDNYYNNRVDTKGWWSNSISSNLQDGQVLNFEEKEGKWFNYIKGTQTTLTNLDTREASVQGIGLASNVTASNDYSYKVTITINENND